MENRFNLIETNKEKSFNQPSLVGRRITVCDVIKGVYYDGRRNYSTDFEITDMQIDECIEYCSSLMCQNEKVVSFCRGCVLRSIQDGTGKYNRSLKEFKDPDGKLYCLDKKGCIYLGGAEEIKNDDFGIPVWVLAEELKSA